ncbi:hypothetical protein pdam_00013722, partial [Pocillopora damicornis]
MEGAGPLYGAIPLLTTVILKMIQMRSLQYQIGWLRKRYTAKNWPTHDPLGRNKPNQKKNVLDPH